jgi:hypothetical protein
MSLFGTSLSLSPEANLIGCVVGEGYCVCGRTPASVVWAWMFKKRKTHGPIALTPDKEDRAHT